MELLNLLKFKKNNQRIIAIDFGASFIKMVHLESAGDRYNLLAYALKELDSISKTPEELSKELKEMMHSASITDNEACLSISDPDGIFVKRITLPSMSREEMLNAIKWQLKGEFTFDPDESVSDLQVIREYTNNEGAKKIDLFCIFARKELVNKYLTAVGGCGLSPVRISCSQFNYSSILNTLPAKAKLSAILDIGQTHSNIAIYQNNKLSFVRSIHFSTYKLCASLIGVLITDKGKVEIDSQKARHLLYQYGIVSDQPEKLEEEIKANQIMPLMRPLLETLVKELGRSFGFLKSDFDLDNPEILYLAGGGANLKDLDNYLEGQLKLKVEKLALPASLDIDKVDKKDFILHSNQFSSALGLGLSVSGINLLPAEIKNQKVELIERSGLRIAAIAISAVLFFSWFVTNFQINDYKKRLKIAKAHLQSIEEIRNLKQTVDLREGLIDIIHMGKVPSGGLLKLIGAVVPPSIILDEYDFSQPNRIMHLKGVVTSNKVSVEKVLTDFMKSLENSNFILDANLVNSEEENGVNRFEIECQLAR